MKYEGTKSMKIKTILTVFLLFIFVLAGCQIVRDADEEYFMKLDNIYGIDAIYEYQPSEMIKYCDPAVVNGFEKGNQVEILDDNEIVFEGKYIAAYKSKKSTSLYYIVEVSHGTRSRIFQIDDTFGFELKKKNQ